MTTKKQTKTKKKKLVSVSGQGYDYSPEIGIFEVSGSIVKQFTKLSEAIEYYESLYEEKAIWDITTIPELLDCAVFEE